MTLVKVTQERTFESQTHYLAVGWNRLLTLAQSLKFLPHEIMNHLVDQSEAAQRAFDAEAWARATTPDTAAMTQEVPAWPIDPQDLSLVLEALQHSAGAKSDAGHYAKCHDQIRALVRWRQQVLR